MQNDEFSDLIRSWLFGMLRLDCVLLRFVQRDKLADEDVARALGMQDWIPGEDALAAYFSRRELTCAGTVSNSKKAKFKYERASALEFIGRQLDAVAQSPVTMPRRFADNCGHLAALFGHKDESRALIAFHILRPEFPVLTAMLEIAKPKNHREYALILASVLDLPPERVEAVLRPGSPLFQCGLLEGNDDDAEAHNAAAFFDPRLARRIVWEVSTRESLIKEFVTPAPEPSLRYGDYPHLKPMIGAIRTHLRRALREKHTGVNLFIYGDPGTGKSEFSRILARDLRAELFEIKSEDKAGTAIDAKLRLSAFTRACALRDTRRSLLLFDDAQSVFRPPSLFTGGLASERKGWMNRHLENNPVPVIWISNSPRGLDPAFSRRFDFVFEMKAPPHSHRIQRYRKLTQRRASTSTLRKLADCPALTPAVVARAASVARGVCASDFKASFDPVFSGLIEKTLQAQGHATTALKRKDSTIPAHYALDCINTDMDLSALPEDLARQPSCRLCLYGPPGTGKTTLGHWLARELNAPLHLKKASDLISPYLGETEQKMAAAFSDAQADHAILMIDEVDSFLQDRSNAQRSWEVSQVNEMLTQIEQFEGVFIASTNLMDDLDRAALRRFDLKLRFDYLQSEQILSLLNRQAKQLGLGRLLPAMRQPLSQLTNCTPGDFANVARQHRFRHFPDTRTFAEALVQECALKNKHGERKLGFSV